MATSGVHLWLVLWKVYSAVSRMAENSIASTGLCSSDFRVLEILLHKGPLPVNTIGQKVGLTSGSISVAVDRLRTKRFVERRNAPNDRRTHLVSLTEDGRSLIEGAFKRHATEMEELLSCLSTQERGEMAAVLKKLGKSAESIAASANFTSKPGGAVASRGKRARTY